MSKIAVVFALAICILIATAEESASPKNLTAPSNKTITKRADGPPSPNEQGFMSKLASWIFPFGGGDANPGDSVAAETHNNGGQYLPPNQNHGGYQTDDDCNPCNKEPWIPVATNYGKNTIIGFMHPSEFKLGMYQSNFDEFRPPLISGDVYGAPKLNYGKPEQSYGIPHVSHLGMGAGDNYLPPNNALPTDNYGPPLQNLKPPGNNYLPAKTAIDNFSPPKGAVDNFGGQKGGIDGFGPPLQNFKPPGEKYGPPFVKPTENYGPPLQHAKPPGDNYGPPFVKPSTEYGLPLQRPHDNYGPPLPKPHEIYGPPQNFKPPSDNYGPPFNGNIKPPVGNYGPPNSGKIQPPSTSYGHPNLDLPLGFGDNFGLPNNFVPGHFRPDSFESVDNFGPNNLQTFGHFPTTFSPPTKTYGPPQVHPVQQKPFINPPGKFFPGKPYNVQKPRHAYNGPPREYLSPSQYNNHYRPPPAKFNQQKFKSHRPTLATNIRPPPIQQINRIPPYEFEHQPIRFPNSNPNPNYNAPNLQLPLAQNRPVHSLKPIPLPNLSLYPLAPLKEHQDFHQSPFKNQHSTNVNGNFNKHQPTGLIGDSSDVQIQQSIAVADYVASIEHPISVVRSPILEVNVANTTSESEFTEQGYTDLSKQPSNEHTAKPELPTAHPVYLGSSEHTQTQWNQNQAGYTEQNLVSFGNANQGSYNNQNQGSLNDQLQGGFNNQNQGSLNIQGNFDNQNQGGLNNQNQGSFTNQNQDVLNNQNQGSYNNQNQGSTVIDHINSGFSSTQSILNQAHHTGSVNVNVYNNGQTIDHHSTESYNKINQNQDNAGPSFNYLQGNIPNGIHSSTEGFTPSKNPVYHSSTSSANYVTINGGSTHASGVPQIQHSNQNGDELNKVNQQSNNHQGSISIQNHESNNHQGSISIQNHESNNQQGSISIENHQSNGYSSQQSNINANENTNSYLNQQGGINGNQQSNNNLNQQGGINGNQQGNIYLNHQGGSQNEYKDESNTHANEHKNRGNDDTSEFHKQNLNLHDQFANQENPKHYNNLSESPIVVQDTHTAASSYNQNKTYQGGNVNANLINQIIKGDSGFTKPEFDYSDWLPNQELSTEMVPPSAAGQSFWLTTNAQSGLEITTKKPKQIQIIIPYTTNGNPTKNLGRKVLPVHTQPPSSESVWTAHSSATTPVINIKDLLMSKSHEFSYKNLPFDIIRFQKNIDGWTEQEYANKMLQHLQNHNLRSTSTTKLGPSKQIPEEYLTTQPYNVHDYETTTFPPREEFFDHEPAGSSSKEYKYKDDDQDVEHNFITSGVSSSTTEKQKWDKIQIAVSPLTKEKVYVVTPQPKVKINSSTESWKNANLSTTFSINILPMRNASDLNDVRIVLSEWPHLINNLETTTHKPKAARHPLLGLMDLSSYAPPENSTIQTFSGHSKVINAASSSTKKKPSGVEEKATIKTTTQKVPT